MKIKQFEANTEKEAMLQVKEEFGKEALIVSVKNIKPKGIFKLFKSPCVQVTAALEEKDSAITKEVEVDDKKIIDDEKDNSIYHSKSIENIEDKINELEQYIKNGQKENHLVIKKEQVSEKNIPLINLIYNQLIKNEVNEKVANKIMYGLNESLSKGNIKINNLVSIIYKRIIHELGEIETVDFSGTGPKIITFIGPTGVGKTTTIAKLASHFALNRDKSIGLITADTYRIAAVEQLRTFAKILNIPVEVVYNNEDIKESIKRFEDKDLIIIDTAGRSHKDNEKLADMEELLSYIPGNEVYLVLSITTKYKDLMSIAESYMNIADFKVIFTKLDESICVGNILNFRYKLGVKLSYVTFGQNVPDDIIEVNPHNIAKSLLGGQG
ncbi:flagellar biosynthesis regulator FlhF [Vallitalea longa]|uniref:Flagellar biosynthesis protein FlhF n=1 Tax=Vallitalea longa TaxID=2936439 RepID=A0A9W6DEZ8_9FIRM|nr:flagellar biosynthesis protein FlhF [Vallitalea longa]GKX28967.1 flagellar biosynthesis regulator FlhF [Vallitalea longa]